MNMYRSFVSGTIVSLGHFDTLEAVCMTISSLTTVLKQGKDTSSTL